MIEVVQEAVIDSLKMLPFLFMIYLIMELLEKRWEDKLAGRVKNAGKAGPVIGALCGVIPQCGFSVMATVLYTKRIVTLGTLLAVYLSTSDEAIPVILAQPGKADVLFPLIASKVIIAIGAGYLIDCLASPSEKFGKKGKFFPVHGSTCCGHIHKHGSNSHHLGRIAKEIIFHSVSTTIKVFVFILAVTLLINSVIFNIGEENFRQLLLADSIFQPVITSIIGLIPNCAASVVITQSFMEGAISFGSAVSGLCTSAGLAMLVLFRESGLKETVRVFGILFGISVFAGIAIQFIYG